MMDSTPSLYNSEQEYLMGEKAIQTVEKIYDSSTAFATDPAQFAMEASVWPLIASRAESLFNFLMQNGVSSDNQYRIEKWLAEKKVCDELINGLDPSDTDRFEELLKESLEDVIKNDEKPDRVTLKSKEKQEEEEEDNDDDVDDEEEYSDVSSENSDFLDKLNECMNKFRIETDEIVDSTKDECKETSIEIIQALPANRNTNSNYTHVAKPVPLRNPNSRRNSILPGSEMCKEVLAFNNSLKCNRNQILNNKTSELINAEHLENTDCGTIIHENLTNCNNNSTDLMYNSLEKTKVSESVKELNSLALQTETKRSQMKNIDYDIHGVSKCIKELRETIGIKQSMIDDLRKNSCVRDTMKQKLRTKLHKMCDTIVEMQLTVLDIQRDRMPAETSSLERQKLRKCCSLLTLLAKYYMSRTKDIEIIKVMADDSVKMLSELEKSVNISKEEMLDLKKQLKKEKKHKKQLKEEVTEGQNKIRELVEQCNLTASKLREIQSESEDEKSNKKSKPDYCDKEKNLLDVSARISHLDHVLKEKAMDLEGTEDMDEKEALRHEIRNLRRTRDCLVDEKCDLDEKFQKEKTLSTIEERKLLECGETIEAIDAMIEHKNEMICGRKCFDENQSQREKGERMLMERLSKLSEGEMRTLFYKYFLKVIDLKESSKNLEVQTAELESHVETQKWQIQTLTNALKQTKLEAERRIVLMQKEYEQKLHTVFRHFADESDSFDNELQAEQTGHAMFPNFANESDSSDNELQPEHTGHAMFRNFADEENAYDNELQTKHQEDKRKYKPKKYIRSTATTLKLPSPPNAPNPVRIPHQEQKPIASSNRSTTKVTRQRNKLIIQKTTNCNKRK